MIVTRIFAGEDGRARIERREVPMRSDESGRATSADVPALRLFFRDTPPAHVHERHRAPQRQCIFVASGAGEIELEDGTLEGIRGFAHVPVPPQFDITRWPALKAE
jgi:quercetin dioxygenase-like cupin family protein